MNKASNAKTFFAYFFSLIGGLGVYLTASKDDPINRTNGMQSILMFVAFLIAMLLSTLLGKIPYIGGLFRILRYVIVFSYIILSIFMIAKGWNGKEYRLPVLGEKAAEIAR